MLLPNTVFGVSDMEFTFSDESYDQPTTSTPHPSVPFRKRFRTSLNYDQVPDVCIPDQQPATDKEEIVLLKLILEKQNKILERLDSHDVRFAKLEMMCKENKIEKSEELTQYKMVRECKVMLRRIHQSICRMTGEEVDELQVEIASTFPLPTLAAAHELEEKLACQEYLEAMKMFLMRLKGTSGSVDDVFRKVYTDEFISFCNWDGRGDKQALSQFSLASEIFYDVFKLEGRISFEKMVRKSIELSHHRLKQRKYRQRSSISKVA